jgi:hypothetical protein
VIGGYGIGMPSSSQHSHMPHPQQQQQMMMATAGGEAHSMANQQIGQSGQMLPYKSNSLPRRFIYIRMPYSVF